MHSHTYTHRSPHPNACTHTERCTPPHTHTQQTSRPPCSVQEPWSLSPQLLAHVRGIKRDDKTLESHRPRVPTCLATPPNQLHAHGPSDPSSLGPQALVPVPTTAERSRSETAGHWWPGFLHAQPGPGTWVHVGFYGGLSGERR